MHIPTYDQQYNQIIQNILTHGTPSNPALTRGRYASDGAVANTRTVLNQTITIAPEDAGVLTTKKFFKTMAINEMLIFWQRKSNHREDFEELNVPIWNQWFITDKESKWYDTIGPAYGYQLGRRVREFPIDALDMDKLDADYDVSNVRISKKQDMVIMLDSVDHLIQSLLKNPESRQYVISLWNTADIDRMALPPCVWSTTWSCLGNTLHLTVAIRSNDMGPGNPFNVFQYKVLLMMIAQVTGLRVGNVTFNITNAHIYDRHASTLAEQIGTPVSNPPTIHLNPDITNFYDFTPDDVRVDFPNGTCETVRRFDISI